MNLPQGTTPTPHTYHTDIISSIAIIVYLLFSLKNSNVKAMYDCTFYVENDFDVSIAHWLKGNPSTITLVCSRIDLSDIPTDPDESKAYLYQLFHEKVPYHGSRGGHFP